MGQGVPLRHFVRPSISKKAQWLVGQLKPRGRRGFGRRGRGERGRRRGIAVGSGHRAWRCRRWHRAGRRHPGIGIRSSQPISAIKLRRLDADGQEHLVRCFISSGYLLSKHSLHVYPSGPCAYPPLPSTMTCPHFEHFVGVKDGGSGIFSKLYSLVPYQTTISGSKSERHFLHVFQSPLWPSL